MSVTILDAIKTANTDAGIKHLSFANLTEFNSFKDGFNFLDYPINVVVPFTINSQYLGNRIKNSVQIRGWMLTRIKQDTNDWRSVKLEVDYIEPLRKLAMTFVQRLIYTDIVDPEQETINATFVPEYQFLDAHLFGVSYSVNLPTSLKIC